MDQRRTLYVVWLALFASTLAYAAVGVVAPARSDEQAMPSDNLNTLAQVLALLAFTNILVTFLIRPLMAKASAFAPYMIIRWALCESAAIFGLVLRFVGADISIMSGFIVAGALAILLTPPNQAERDRYDALRAG
jgi:hypothetical protein